MELCEDRIGGGSPAEGFAVLVVMGDEVIDLADEFIDRAKRDATDSLVGNQCGITPVNRTL